MKPSTLKIMFTVVQKNVILFTASVCMTGIYQCVLL